MNFSLFQFEVCFNLSINLLSNLVVIFQIYEEFLVIFYSEIHYFSNYYFLFNQPNITIVLTKTIGINILGNKKEFFSDLVVVSFVVFEETESNLFTGV